MKGDRGQMGEVEEEHDRREKKKREGELFTCQVETEIKRAIVSYGS